MLFPLTFTAQPESAVTDAREALLLTAISFETSEMVSPEVPLIV
jgi:hypothetical protein